MNNGIKRNVFVTGANGYIGSRVVPVLLERGHKVKALVRKGSEHRLLKHHNLEIVVGDALRADTFKDKIAPSDTFLQLVGVAHPNPKKSKLFHEIDLVSIQQSVNAAVYANIAHFIYISVTPSDMMHEYSMVRAEGEKLINESKLNATILRPFYVLGPGHYWPIILLPVYAIMKLIPSQREKANRLGLVTIKQMVNTLVHIVENPVRGERIVEIPEIKAEVK